MTALTVVQAVAFTAVGVIGIAVVLTRDPLRQVVTSGLFGLALVLLFAALQAPDVAIAELVVSTVALPMVLLTILYKTGGGGRG